MRIGINTRFLLSSKMEGFGWFTYEVVKRIVEKHPEHEFVFFFDRQYDEKFIFASNVKPVVLFPPTRSVVLILSWFECALPRALKKEKIDVFFSPDGFLSLRSSIKQIGVIHDLNFLHHPKDVPWRFRVFYHHFFQKYAFKATELLTVSEYSKQDMIQSYAIDPEKITVAWNGVSDLYQPISDLDKQAVRKQYTSGEDFFLFVGALHPRKNLKTLLKAFESYRRKGNKGKLLIVGENLFSSKKLSVDEIDMQTRNQIFFTGHLPLNELVRITASALALVYVSYFEGFGIPLVEAMKCGTPIISGNLTALPEVVGDAAILVDPMNVEEIASEMERLEMNKELHRDLSAKGIQRATLFNWDFTADKVWQVIERTLNAD